MKKSNLTETKKPAVNYEKNTIPKFLTPDEVCAMLKISKGTLYNLTFSRKIPFYKIVGLRFKLEDILAWIEEKRVDTYENRSWQGTNPFTKF